jgi:CBS domain
MKRKELMTPEVEVLSLEATLQQAAVNMRRLPILSRAKRLVGMVSLGDLAVSSGNAAQGREPRPGCGDQRGAGGCRGPAPADRRAAERAVLRAHRAARRA